MPRNGRLTTGEKLALATRIWLRFLQVSIETRRRPLPAYVAELARDARASGTRHPARTVAHAVDRSLRLGRHRPRCLINALVLFRLLQEQGDAPVLVIGLPERPTDERAHAWVELDGRDVGPPPGGRGYRELGRLP